MWEKFSWIDIGAAFQELKNKEKKKRLGEIMEIVNDTLIKNLK